MAVNTGNDKSIGKLTIDISDVQEKIKEVNKFLGQIGANIDLEDKLSKKISAALNKLVTEARKAGEEAKQAIGQIGGAGSDKSVDSIASRMELVTDTVKTYVRHVDEAGKATMQLAQTVKTGMDQAGATIKEFSDAGGNITKRTEEVKRSYEEEIELAYKQAEVQEAAEQKKAEAAVQSALKRDEASRQAAEKELQREQERNAKELAMMDEALEKQKATLEKQVSDFEQAEERKRQTSINSEFEREEARKRAIQSEQEQMAKEIAMMDEAIAKQEQEFQTQKINEAETAYRNLTTAVRNYNIEKKTGNTDRQDMWAKEASSQMQVLSNLEQEINELNIDENARQRILSYVEQGRTAQAGMTAETGNTSAKTGELESQVKGLVTRYLSLMAVIRTINSLMNNMVEYVSEYSDKMNEIQMITLKTDDEIANLAETYRGLAADMSVSSLDMADAAIYFTRQGLAAEEIENRLKNVTMYAKAANVEFKDASEIITAVVNSMNLVEQEAEDGRNAAQRVADVFLQIGDHAATSGQEIGEAMQKAAASAGAFGVSMEWLAAYIATVSETTRQEARTIGTAFNTIIARLHQIKSTGYNQEDETKVNDIAKALSKIDIVLMDQEGNWRDMEDILIEVSEKWGDLDGKTKSYIATTMAGVKQQNVFLALMNDMSKGADEGSRAFELYNMAMDSTGVAAEKYGVYLDSVTAAQERLTIAQEKFYAILDENVIKNWYKGLAEVVNFITSATEGMNGLNIIIPLVAGGITLLNLGFIKLSASITAAGNASAFFASVWEKHPVLFTITAVAGVIAGLTIASGALQKIMGASAEKFEAANKAISEYNTNIQNAESKQNSLAEMLADVEENTELSSAQLSKYNTLLESLESVSARARIAVLNLRNGFGDQREQIQILNEELDAYIRTQQKLAAMEGVKKYNNYQTDNGSYGLSSRMINWGEFSDQESFTSALRNAYEKSKYDWDEAILGYEHSTANRFLPQNIRDQIKEMFAQMNKSGTYESYDDMWKDIANIIWGQYFGGDTSYNLSKYLSDEVNASIDDAMELVGSNMNPVDFAAVRKQLTDMIFGEDMELDDSEYLSFTKKIASFIAEMLSHDFDPSYLDIPIEDKVVAYVSSMFAGVGEELNAAIENDIKDIFANNTELYDAFIEAMSELMSAGFDKTDIYDVLMSTPVEQWDQACEVFKEEIIAGLRDVFETPIEGETTDTAFNEMIENLFGEMDLKTLKSFNDIIDSLLDIDVDVDQIKKVIDASESMEEMFENLRNLQQENGISTKEDIGVIGSLKDFIKEAKAAIKDIQAIDSAIESVKKNIAEGSDINYGDIFGLIELHPEIMTVIGDSEKLLATLKKVREEASKTQHDSFRNLLFEKGVTAGTKFEDSGYEMLSEYRKSIEGNEEAIAEFEAEIDKLAQNLQLADENFKQTAKDIKEETKAAKKDFDDAIKEVETLDKVISKLQDNKKIDFSDIISLAKTHPEIMNFIDDTDALIAALERLKAKEKEVATQDLKNIMLTSEDWFKESEYYDGIHKNLTSYLNDLEAAGGDWQSVLDSVDATAEKMVEGSDAASTAAETWLEAQMKIAEINDQVNWAKANNFEEQISQLQEANERGGIQEAMQLYNSWDNEMQQAIGTTYPEFVSQFAKASKAIKEQGEETADLTEQTEELGDALKTAQRINEIKYFKDAAKAVKQLSEGTISATDAYEVYNKEIQKVSKAYEEIQKYREKQAYNAKEVNKDNQKDITVSDVQDLANLLDMTAEQVLADFPAAVDMFNELTGSAGELQEVLQMLNKEAFIKITGVSDADFSKILEGLVYVEDEADKAVQKLLQTGQWELEARETHGWQDVLEGNQIVNKELNGKYWILKPSSGNPFSGHSSINSYKDTTPKKSSSGKSSGGGGSSEHNTKKTETEVEHALDLMSQINAINQAQQNFYQAQQKYYSQTGQIQGVIAYMQKEREELESQKPLLEGNIKEIERYMAQKKAELAALSTSDEAYAEVADDLDKLQKAHQNYTKQLIDNNTAVEALNEAMEEQRKKIRQMEIDLRNTVLKAIEDREKKNEDMLNAEIQMENKILDLIKKRYEMERDEILRVTDQKIEALQQERDLLSEQLEIRKKQEETEDKVAQLKALEVKYQRIIADPTRAKEAQKIRTDIDKLRKEMAWDAAEEEVKSQQDALDQQITSLEDYKNYIEEFYEDMFEHPQALIEEMRNIIMGTQQSIIEWLKANDAEYKKSSENTQKSMVDGWKQTYDDMKGILKTYWEEVEFIISQGDDYIIEFLQNNSADYAAAGKLQAEAYVDEWRKQLSDLKKAHQQVAAEIAAEYEAIAKSTYVAPSGGGGSSGGSSKHGYTFTYNGTEYTNSGYASAELAQAAGMNQINALAKQGRDAVDKKYPYSGTVHDYEYNKVNDLYNVAKSSLTAYGRGGMASFTGPAWLDGSPQDPERILSPYQTKLFETMISALENIDRVMIPSMSNYSNLQATGGGNVSVGDIVVNVDNLDTEDDYEEMADKVCAILMERIGQTTAIGGLRIRSV